MIHNRNTINNEMLPALGATERLAEDETHAKVRLYTHTGCQWFLIEYDSADDVAFAYCDLGQGMPEYGYVSLKELDAVPVSVYTDDSWDTGRNMRDVRAALMAA